jgi:hypothetical protein
MRQRIRQRIHHKIRQKIRQRLRSTGGQIVGLGVVGLLAMSSPVSAYQEVQVTNGGAVTGTVRFTGPVPPAKAFELWRAPNRNFCAGHSDGSGYRYLQEVWVEPSGGLKNVVVTIEDVEKGKPFELEETRLEANICLFFPFVSVVRDRHPMTIFNLDPVSHDLQVYERDREHVFIMFHRSSLTRTGTTDTLNFSGGRREMIMQCGMHPYMQAHGVAVVNPYYAVTDVDGQFEITGLPPGTYRIRAWHPVLPPHERKVTVEAGGTTIEDFTFSAPVYR